MIPLLVSEIWALDVFVTDDEMHEDEELGIPVVGFL